ncbi:hypothetical protein BLAT2472_11149 [Burkholderia latens]
MTRSRTLLARHTIGAVEKNYEFP